MRKFFLVLALLVFAVPCSAQEPNPLYAPSLATEAEIVSGVLVGTNLALDMIDAFKSKDGVQLGNVLRGVCRVSIAVVGSQALKMATDRLRPNGQDYNSFPSMHTAVAQATAGWSVRWGTVLTLGVAANRQIGGDHYISDTAAGGGIGEVARRICPDKD